MAVNLDAVLQLFIIFPCGLTDSRLLDNRNMYMTTASATVDMYMPCSLDERTGQLRPRENMGRIGLEMPDRLHAIKHSGGFIYIHSWQIHQPCLPNQST